MDVFKEQIVRRKPSKNNMISKGLIILSAVSLAMVCFLFTFGTQFILIGLVVAGGALYGGYYLLTNQDVEYEYILTNGDMDFDKIIAQRKRKRMCTIKIGSATDFGKVSETRRFSDAQTHVRVDAGDEDLEDYFIRLNHKELGDVVVYFTPNEEMLELIKPFIPRQLRGKIEF